MNYLIKFFKRSKTQNIIKFKLNRKKIWDIIGKIANIWWVISLWILIFSLIPISNKINNIQKQLNEKDAETTLISYLSYIENENFKNAFDLFSEEKKHQHTYTWFVDRLEWFVAFEGLKITYLPEKSSAVQKVFLTEFWFKKRGMKSIETKRWFYLRYDWNKREINYSNVLYDENKRNSTACSFYNFEHCK